MVKNARRAGCIGSGESRGTIQVGGIPYRPGCRLQGNGDSTRVQGGAGWRVGRGSNHKNHKFTADDSTDCVECFRAGCGWRQPAINGETKRCGSSQARPTRSCDDSTRLDEGQPEHPEAGLHHHQPPPGSEPFVVPEKSTNPGHWTPGGGPSSTTPENAWAAWFALEPTPVLFSSGPLIGREPLLIPATVASACPPFTPFRPLLLGRLPASADKRACTEPQSPVHDALYQRNHWPARGN